MVAGMRPRMPPPSMLRIVMSFPVDGGGCGTVAQLGVPLLMLPMWLMKLDASLVENLRMDCSSLLLVCMCVSWVLCSGSAGSGKLYLCP